jgi:hypothetical protein
MHGLVEAPLMRSHILTGYNNRAEPAAHYSIKMLCVRRLHEHIRLNSLKWGVNNEETTVVAS